MGRVCEQHFQHRNLGRRFSRPMTKSTLASNCVGYIIVSPFCTMNIMLLQADFIWSLHLLFYNVFTLMNVEVITKQHYETLFYLNKPLLWVNVFCKMIFSRISYKQINQSVKMYAYFKQVFRDARPDQ